MRPERKAPENVRVAGAGSVRRTRFNEAGAKSPGELLFRQLEERVKRELQ